MELCQPDSVYLSVVGQELLARFREMDVLLRPLGNSIYVMPPYCIGSADLGVVYDAIGVAADSLSSR